MNSPLRDQIRSASASLVRREKLTLPECGIEVQVRGLMAGEALRVAEAKRRLPTQIALATEDPSTGKPLWLSHSADDLNEIEGLHSADFTALLEKVNELSGLDRPAGKSSSPNLESSSSPSPSDLDEALPS